MGCLALALVASLLPSASSFNLPVAARGISPQIACATLTSPLPISMAARGAKKGKEPATAEEKKQRRVAGVQALKSLASIYRERTGAADDDVEAYEPTPEPAAPARAPSRVEDPGLFGTLSSLAAAKAEVVALRARDRAVNTAKAASLRAQAVPLQLQASAIGAAKKAQKKVIALPQEIVGTVNAKVDGIALEVKGEIDGFQSKVQGELDSVKSKVGQ